MINKDYSDLITPALLMIVGLYIRFGKNEKLSVSGRKFWLFFLLGGLLMFVLRLSRIL
jgi:uncharacterized membrane protein